MYPLSIDLGSLCWSSSSICGSEILFPQGSLSNIQKRFLHASYLNCWTFYTRLLLLINSTTQEQGSQLTIQVVNNLSMGLYMKHRSTYCILHFFENKKCCTKISWEFNFPVCSLSFSGVPRVSRARGQSQFGRPPPGTARWQDTCKDWVGSKRTPKTDSGPAAHALVSRPVLWKLHMSVTSELWGRYSRIQSQLASDNALAQAGCFVPVGLLRSKFSGLLRCKCKGLLRSKVSGNMVEEIIIPTGTKNL